MVFKGYFYIKSLIYYDYNMHNLKVHKYFFIFHKPESKQIKKIICLQPIL